MSSPEGEAAPGGSQNAATAELLGRKDVQVVVDAPAG
jgi:hypothetical protein